MNKFADYANLRRMMNWFATFCSDCRSCCSFWDLLTTVRQYDRCPNPVWLIQPNLGLAEPRDQRNGPVYSSGVYGQWIQQWILRTVCLPRKIYTNRTKGEPLSPESGRDARARLHCQNCWHGCAFCWPMANTDLTKIRIRSTHTI